MGAAVPPAPTPSRPPWLPPFVAVAVTDDDDDDDDDDDVEGVPARCT